MILLLLVFDKSILEPTSIYHNFILHTQIEIKFITCCKILSQGKADPCLLTKLFEARLISGITKWLIGQT